MNIKLAVLPGDGIGPEIVEQAMKTVKAVCRKFGHQISTAYALTGATAIEKTGDPYPAETHELCMDQSDGQARTGLIAHAQSAGPVCKYPAG
jgi:3-isopropylmalate dehydrogenase